MNKVWAYTISKALTESETDQLIQSGKKFVSGWTAHEHQLSASFSVFNKRIILIQVDENVAEASGCSIDKLMHFVKDMEKQFQCELLNRLLIPYKKAVTIEVIHSAKIKALLDSKDMDEDTLVYNTAVSTSKELEVWEQALKNTWLNKYLIKT